MTVQTRLPFGLDTRAEAGALTAHGGVPLLIEVFRTSGAAAVLDASVVIKRRERGLPPAALVEGSDQLTDPRARYRLGDAADLQVPIGTEGGPPLRMRLGARAYGPGRGRSATDR